MLVEAYPAAQVMQAAEDGCLFEGHLHEGWLLLSKVLSELNDLDDAILRAQDEYQPLLDEQDARHQQTRR